MQRCNVGFDETEIPPPDCGAPAACWVPPLHPSTTRTNGIVNIIFFIVFSTDSQKLQRQDEPRACAWSSNVRSRSFANWCLRPQGSELLGTAYISSYPAKLINILRTAN